jgi:MoxR-like ATPase
MCGSAALAAPSCALPELVRRSRFRPEDVFPQHLLTGGAVTLGDLFPDEFVERGGQSCHSVVLIDEIDKAPRDAPNDILFEIEAMSFEIEEIGITVSALPTYKPIVVITSNSERNLPDAFMRRCVFYNMTLPTGETLRKIAAVRLGDGLRPESGLIKEAETFFSEVSKAITEKKPGTAEFIGLVAFLQRAGVRPEGGFSKESPLARDSLKVMAKTQADLAAAERHILRAAG